MFSFYAIRDTCFRTDQRLRATKVTPTPTPHRTALDSGGSANRRLSPAGGRRSSGTPPRCSSWPSSWPSSPTRSYVFYGTIRCVFHDDRVTTDELFAIGTAFTVLAWGFAFVFVAVEILWPGSIEPLSQGSGRFFDLLFFS